MRQSLLFYFCASSVIMVSGLPLQLSYILHVQRIGNSCIVHHSKDDRGKHTQGYLEGIFKRLWTHVVLVLMESSEGVCSSILAQAVENPLVSSLLSECILNFLEFLLFPSLPLPSTPDPI